MRDLELDLEVFSGPFDLLLTLVLREEVDLLEVELADVVLAYLDHLEARGELDLEVATEFLVLIAALLELKSRLMLPREEEELLDVEPEMAADELLARMLEARRYRSASLWLHMGAFGPRRIVTATDVHTPAAPYALVNNGSSLLDATDLVFIDAPGTGFSRIAGKDKEKAFFGVDPDAYAFAEFISQFLSKYGRWNSPKYLFGESYGTPRSAVLVNQLQADRSIDFNAVILLSQLREIYIDAELEPVDTVQWYPRLLRKDYTVGLNVTETGVDDPDQQFYENYVCGADRNYLDRLRRNHPVCGEFCGIIRSLDRGRL